MSLNTIAGTLGLLTANGLAVYLLVFNTVDLTPLPSVCLTFIIMLNYGIFFMCYNKENPKGG